ncbi:MAG: hypothetical protein JWM32_1193 [Verrucomicrobia bacterium]|nr:hypothetical protein [Verrucomicrobiota bacterium]
MKKISHGSWLRFFLGCVASGFFGLAARAADEVMKECPQCRGSGIVTCKAGCVHGVRDCPGPCLKLTSGTWIHMPVAGHPDSDWWQKFYMEDGRYQAWNQHHLGEVVEMRNGTPTIAGRCAMCKGTTKVPCPGCAGKGEVECPLCRGLGQVATTVHAPDEIPLKDGRVLRGKIVAQRGEMIQIRTEDGKTQAIRASDLANPEKKLH